ncbi:group III truncated hemoglobin [Algibacter amylolyticus]|uniref:Group III truncated hemoglobin n=1 Tax=Algibacter amylolyticus TaxID=1608400 RepID=A0A5M7B7D1_9FLAO|nr:group III truncated hemoglobin [Algibacter amylolyticus]KAA5823554.1 group III truncated hemoglobin [Algibacter amylolyticus]MBB5267708.1 hemoglobin [Algibacter amylolyticus]TSJ74042.1 group III truncated hemoglobin [Algibacter amylolyticus]
MKTDIQTREDVALLVTSFYKKVRAHNVLGPFFNDVIKDWDAHLERLTTFWETSLFMTRKLEHKYHGDPLQAHVKVDKDNNNSITELHFGLWLNIWFETLEELFEGEVTENAKRRARKMGSFLYLKIFEARSK